MTFDLYIKHHNSPQLTSQPWWGYDSLMFSGSYWVVWVVDCSSGGCLGSICPCCLLLLWFGRPVSLGCQHLSLYFKFKTKYLLGHTVKCLHWKVQHWYLLVYIHFNPRAQIHRAALADKIASQINLLSRFLWLPAKLSYKMYAFWLVVCFILLSKNICLAKFSA